MLAWAALRLTGMQGPRSDCDAVAPTMLRRRPERGSSKPIAHCPAADRCPCARVRRADGRIERFAAHRRCPLRPSGICPTALLPDRRRRSKEARQTRPIRRWPTL